MADRRTVKLAATVWLGPFIITGFLFFVPVVKYQPISSGVFLVLVAFTVFPVFAWFAAATRVAKSANPLRTAESSNKYSCPLLAHGPVSMGIGVLAIIFCITSIYDNVALSGALREGVTVARNNKIAEGASWSVLGGMATYLMGAPALWAVAILESQLRGAKAAAAYLLLVLSIFCLFLNGGRNGFLINLIFCACYIAITNMDPVNKYYYARIIQKVKTIVAPFLMVSLAFSLWLFLDRANVLEVELAERIEIFAADYGVNLVGYSYVPAALLPIYFIAISVYFYLTISFNALGFYFAGEAFQFTFGAYTFYTILAPIDFLFSTSITVSVMEKIIRPGFYYSLPGSLYIDFGFAGVFMFSIIWFVFGAAVLRSGRKGGPIAKLWASYFLTSALLAPLYSIFSIGSGPSLFYLMTALTFYSYLFRRGKGALTK